MAFRIWRASLALKWAPQPSAGAAIVEPAEATSHIVMPSHVMLGVPVASAVYAIASTLEAGRVAVAYDVSAENAGPETARALRGLGLHVEEFEVGEHCRGYGHQLEHVERLARLVQESGAEVLVSLGSPCMICAAKLAKVRVHRPTLDLSRITVVTHLGIHGRKPIHIAVPVGSAMGREADPLARAYDGGRSILAVNRELVPEVAVIDPTLAASLRPQEARDAVLDLFTHTFEAIASVLSNPVTGDYALLALRRLARALPILANGRPLDPLTVTRLWRELGLMSLYTGLAVASSSLSLTCALAVATQEEFPSLPHGAVSAVYLPRIIRLYEERKASAAALFASLLEEAGLLEDGESASEAASRLLARLGAPRSLAELGVDRERLEAAKRRIARRAAELGGYLSQLVVSSEALERVIMEAYSGGGGA